MATPVKYCVGETVYCGDILCKIENILHTNLGFNKYQVCDVQTGERWTVTKENLEKFTMDENEEIGWDAVYQPEQQPEYEEIIEHQKNEDIHQQIQSRHAVMTDCEIDQVARERLSRNTEQQTKWSVNLFKG